MKCRIGVHTGRVDITFGEEQYVELKQALPAPIGRRSWYLNLAGGTVVLRRSSFGTEVFNVPKGYRGIGNEQPTIVRCTTMDAEMRFEDGRLGIIEMPPYHLWPWIKDARSRLRNMSMYDWRWHLVQELNERVRSATRAHVDMPKDLPDWVRDMLTGAELAKVLTNQEIA